MTGRPLMGLCCALLVEGCHWIKLRWDFNDSSYESAWQLSFVLMVLTAMMIWLDESRYTAALVLMGWMPLLLMPLQFVQGYGMRGSVQLAAFSLLARRSRLRSQRLGLMTEPVEFNFGNVTFVVTLIASAVGMDVDSELFLPGVIVLAGWKLISTGRCRWGSLLPLLLVCGGLGLAGEQVMERLEKWIRRGGHHANLFNPNFQSTSIGQRGRVLQSPEVLWRLSTNEGAVPPRLLRTSTFSNFLGLSWQNRRTGFEELDRLVIDGESHHLINPDSDEESLGKRPAFQLKGSVSKVFPMPLPGDVDAMYGLGDARVEKDTLGTIKVTPADPVIAATVLWRGEQSPEGAASTEELTHIAAVDQEVIWRMVREIGLADQPTVADKLRVLQQWFNEEFRYTLDLTIRQPSYIDRAGGNRPPSAMEQFLTEVRAGHCEYFATAATLMLREVGVPARYAVGFVVMEYDAGSDEFVIRGTHAHAWCRVWDAERGSWVDFDPTPPDWLSGVATQTGWLQGLKDGLKSVREDFYLWRTHPANELKVMVLILSIGAGLVALVIRRLWRSRSHLTEDGPAALYRGPKVRTPLHRLETLAKECVGKRPRGMTYVCWLMGIEQRCGPLDGLKEAVVLHQRCRFDPEPLAAEGWERLEQLVARLEDALRSRIKSTS